MNSPPIPKRPPIVKTVLDKAAGGQLPNLLYYRWDYDNRPDWQKARRRAAIVWLKLKPPRFAREAVATTVQGALAARQLTDVRGGSR